VSGIAILLAHPRFYWGETGAVGAPSLFDVPLPFTTAHSGWGRHLHFLAGWVCVFAGVVYVLYGLLCSHFRKTFFPSKRDLSLRSMSVVLSNHLRLKRPMELEYNVLQKFAYLTVVFVLFPAIIVTGLAMSPTITSVIPALSGIFGGRQSARTVHFVLAASLVLFLLVHIAMVCLGGFTTRVQAMITGYHTKRG
jgi:thiosulfate reductase cytochrome b subunit